jgi:hypothetical protein
MNAACFIAGAGEIACAAARRITAAVPNARWTLVCRPEATQALAEILRPIESLTDKPIGGRLRAIRALRSRRFDLVVLTWLDLPGGARLSALGLLAGGRRCLVLERDGRLLPLTPTRADLWRAVWRRLRLGPTAPDLLSAGLRWPFDRTIGRWLAARRIRAAAAPFVSGSFPSSDPPAESPAGGRPS